MPMKTLTSDQKLKIEQEIKMMLHASRDCMMTQFLHGGSYHNPNHVRYVVSDGYYGEAYGIMRGIKVMGYGYFGAHNMPIRDPNRPGLNLNAWFDKLSKEVLEEENFGGSNECDYCLEHFGRDGAGRQREP
jgi:hypothetical protein